MDGFQDPNPAPVTTGGPGKYVDTGLNTIAPVQQYSHTRPLVLPDNLTQVGCMAHLSADSHMCLVDAAGYKCSLLIHEFAVIQTLKWTTVCNLTNEEMLASVISF